MEYSTNGITWTAIAADPLNIASLIPTANDATLRIRYAAIDGGPASLAANLNLPRRPASPEAVDVRFDGFTESLGATGLMEFRVGSTGAFTEVPAGETGISVNIGTSSQAHQVRVRATDTMFASSTFAVTVPARGAAPNAVYNGYIITGVSSTMEFSLDNGETWAPVTANTIPRDVLGDTATTVMVRVRATATAPSSNIRSVDVLNAGSTPPTGIVLDTYDESVTGVSDEMEFSTNGISWTTVTSDSLIVTGMVSVENDVTLRVRYRAANGVPASLPANVTLPRRPVSPTAAAVRFDGLTESIAADGSMEYRIGSSGVFMPVPGGGAGIPVSVDAATQSFQVRVRATDTLFASAIQTVTVPARGAAPNVTFDGSVDMITGVSGAMEYSLNNGGAWSPINASNIPRSVFGGAATTVMVRVRATATAPSSAVRSIDVPGEGEVFPKGLALDTRSETVTGVSSLMEFSTNGTSWTTISSSTLNISNMIPAANASSDVTLRVRYRAAGGSPASFAVNILIPRRPAAPTGVRFDGLTESINATALMEFRVGTTGDFSVVPAGDTSIPVSIGTASQVYQVRVRAADTTFVSATHAVTVPVRAAAPNAVFNSTQNTITGVSSLMEYSLNNGTTWTSVSTSSLTRSVFGNAATTVMVRVRATANAPSSNIRTVEVPGA
jgi:hypothetical protein